MNRPVPPGDPAGSSDLASPSDLPGLSWPAASGVPTTADASETDPETARRVTRRRRAVLAVLTVAVLAVAGWMWLARDSDPLANGPVAGTRDLLITPTSHRAAPSVTAVVLPAAPRHAVSMPWRFESLSDDGLDLAIVYAGGDGYCLVPRGVLLDENETRVVLAAVSVQQHSGACPNTAVIGREIVRLGAPLGRRALVHAVAEDSWTDLIGD